MKVVIDTNIFLVMISPKSRYYWMFKKFLNGDYTLCVTTDILQEYEEIITKHMGQNAANYALQIIENAPNVMYITKYFRWNLIFEDPDDNKFVDCAISANAKYLVTHDRHFNVLKKIPFPKVEVIDVTHFGELIQ